MGWRDAQPLEPSAPATGWRAATPLEAARPATGPIPGPGASWPAIPRRPAPPTVDVIPPEEMVAGAPDLAGVSGIGIGVQPGAERLITPAPPEPGGAEPYQAGGGGWLTDAIWGSYALAPGLGPLAAYFWQQGMTPRDAARMIAQGATLSSSDELMAYARAALGEDRNTALAQERQANNAIEEEFPVTSAVAKTAGAVGAGALGGSVLGAMGVGAPASTLGRVLVGGATGAVAGGVDAFNAGEGGTEARLSQVVPGAITGGVFGAAIPLIGKAAGVAYNALRGPAADAYENALRILRSKLKSDTVTPADVGARLDELGPDAMIVDAAGPNVSRLGGSMYRAPGEASTTAYDALSARARGQGDRVYNAFTGTYSPGRAVPDYFEATDALMAQRARDAAPLYDKAFARGTGVLDMRVDQFLADPIVRQGLKQGLEIQRLEALAAGKPFDPTEYAITGFNEAGDPIMGTVPNFRLLDAAKRGLDNILEQFRNPVTGKLDLDSRGRAIEAVRKAYVEHLDTLNPDYAAARAAWAGPSQALDAMALGRRIVTEDNRAITRMLDGMSPTEREFVQAGVVDAVRRTIATAPDAADAVKRIFGNNFKRDALAALFDDPAQFAAFQRRMEAETKFFMTQTNIMGNSLSAERGAADAANGVQNFGASPGGDFVLNVTTGTPPGTAALARTFLDGLLSDMPRATPATNAELARMLFNQTPAQNAATLDALARIGVIDRQTGMLKAGAQTGFSGLLGAELPPWAQGRGRGLLEVQ
jgi:hypothetical protein